MIKSVLIFLSLLFVIELGAQNNTVNQKNLDSFFQQADTIKDLGKQLSFIQNELKSRPSISEIDKFRFQEKIAKNYTQQLKIDSAFIYINAGLVAAENLKIDSTICKFYHFKGVAYYYIGKLNEAFSEFEKSEKISRRIAFKKQQASTLSNMGAIKIDLQDLEKAEPFLKESISIFESINQHTAPNNILANRLLATLYYRKGDINRAFPIFNHLVEISKQTNSPDTQVSAQTYVALCLGKLGRKNEAIATFEDLITVVESINNPDSEAAVLDHYATYLEEQGNYKKALELSKKGWRLRKQIFDEQLGQAVSDAEVKYKTDLSIKEKEIAQLEVAQKNNELGLAEKKQENQFWIIVALIALLSFTVILTFVFLRIRKLKAKQELERERINAILTGQEKERERVAKDLHDGIVQDITAIKHKFQLSLADKSENPTYKDILEDLTKAGNEVRNISYQLMPLALREFGLQASLEALFERTKLIHNIEYECTFLGMEERLTEQMEVTIYRVCQELIHNAVKHSQTKVLHALFKRNETNIQINFEDNGIGFDEKTIREGIGLSSIKSRVEMVGGTIEKDFAQENSGTVFYIKLPL